MDTGESRPANRAAGTTAPTAWSRRARYAAAAIIALGIAARIICYLSNPSLFVDGASLSLNIVDRSFGELFLPLDHLQAAPAGLLILMKAATLAFGANEYALRLVPLIGSLLIFPLFILLARRSLGTVGSLVGLAMVATSWPLVRYGTLVKQYGTDATVCAGLLLLGIGSSTRLRDWRAGLALALGGMACLTLSHPAVFVLAALGTVLVIRALLAKQWREVVTLGVVGAAWLSVFVVLFFLNMRPGTQNGRLVQCWANSFLPCPPRSMADIELSVKLLFGVFATPLGPPTGVPLSGLVLILSATGCAALARTRRGWLGIALPLVFTFMIIVSAAQKYPLVWRLMAFTIPALALLCGAAVEHVTDHWKRLRATGTIIACVLLAPGIVKTAVACVAPPATQELRPLLQRLAAEAQAGDVVCIHRTATSAHGFYSRYGDDCWRNDLVAVPISDSDTADTLRRKAAEASATRRLWLLFSMHNETVGGERERLCREMEARGDHLQTLSTVRAKADLFAVGGDAPPGDQPEPDDE